MSRLRTAILLPARGAPGLDRALPIDDLPHLQRLVGGYIQLVRLSHAQVRRAQLLYPHADIGAAPNTFLVVHEEGKLLGLPPNATATAIVVPELDDVIVGDALVVEMPPSDDDAAGEA